MTLVKYEEDPKIKETLAELKALLGKLPDGRQKALDDFLTKESAREETHGQEEISNRRF